ncbi:hypothetical protein MRX96_003815 [Rhipicephalus microplus]
MLFRACRDTVGNRLTGANHSGTRRRSTAIVKWPRGFFGVVTRGVDQSGPARESGHRDAVTRNDPIGRLGTGRRTATCPTALADFVETRTRSPRRAAREEERCARRYCAASFLRARRR